jgi:subtilisin family serine protease
MVLAGMVSVLSAEAMVSDPSDVLDNPQRDPNGASTPALNTQGQTPVYAKQEFIVKFKDSVTECVHCLLEEKESFQSAVSDHTEGLDQLNRKHNVHSAKSLFGERCGLKTEQAKKKFQMQSAKAQNKFTKRQKRAPERVVSPDLSNVYVLEVAEGVDIQQACKEFASDPHVEYAEPNYTYSVQMVPNDPYYSSKGTWGQSYDDLWGIKKIQPESAWDLSQGAGVVVAVVDTGIDYNHEDLASNVWINPGEIAGNGVDDDRNGYVDDTKGWDFAYGDKDPMDGNGHGTHVAGTIAAVGNNNLGVIGVAHGAKVMAVKGLNNGGSGTTSALANALLYATANGADVLSNSWGGSGHSQVIEDVINMAYSQGVVIVAAAGNSTSDASNFSPAGLVNVITVAASDVNDAIAYFSNYGKAIDAAAPGVEILSLRANGTDIYKGSIGYTPGSRFVPAGDPNAKYYRANGTSMAAPHVSGLAALILSKNPQFSNAQVKSALCMGADDLGTTGRDDQYGYGRINVTKALQIINPIVLPYALIQSPKAGQPLKGTSLDVIGTATAEAGYFQNFTLDYDIQHFDTITDNWQSIATGTQPIQDAFLAKLDFSTLNNGYYFLRARANSLDPRNPSQLLSETHQMIAHIGNKIKAGWPVIMPGAVRTSPAIADLDRDGKKEVVVIDEFNNLYVLDSNGRVYSEWGWPKKLPETSNTSGSPALGDLDNDPNHDLEIVIGNKYAFHHDGVPVIGWPNPLFSSSKNSITAATLEDIDGDGSLEVMIRSYTSIMIPK